MDGFLGDGPGLAYALRGKSAAERAVIAAEYGDEALWILKPTKAQRARLFKVSTPTLNAALALPPEERARVKRGLCPLIEPKDRLKAALSAVKTDADVVCVINEIGFNHVWLVVDRMTQPELPLMQAAE
jgi:hypothetical protein